MQPPKFYINQKQLDQLIGQGAWKVNELPLDKASEIKPFFAKYDAFAFYSSGVKLPSSGALRAGIDWVRNETKPIPGESSLNVYHYVVGNIQPNGYPVYGPIDDQSLAPHWSDLNDLDVYYRKGKPNRE